nr:hypothetical protein [uncultured bacterium]
MDAKPPAYGKQNNRKVAFGFGLKHANQGVTELFIFIIE